MADFIQKATERWICSTEIKSKFLHLVLLYFSVLILRYITMSNLFTETFSSLTTFREWTEARNGNFIEPLISYFFTVDPQFCHQWGWFIDQTTDIRSGLIVLVLTYTFALLAFSLGILVLYGVGIFSDKEPKKGLKGINRQGAVQLAATQLFYAVIGTIVYYVNNYVNSMCVGY